MSRKQALLHRHRRNKRLALLGLLLVLVAAGVWLAWWLPVVLGIVAWAGHEAWFADHLFYAPGSDYQYTFPAGSEVPGVLLEGGRIGLQTPLMPDGNETLLLCLEVRSTWLGRFMDPAVELCSVEESDCQVFERGVNGLRYLNLSSFGASLAAGELKLRGRFCRLAGQPRLWRFANPDVRGQRLMVIAPHADDAELAAYGLYSQASEAWIVTLTAGEIEAGHYRDMGLERSAAARMKGRLRAWDSIAVPRWAGVAAGRCVQLGYFCLQLPAMQAAPNQPVASREADLSDTRLFRQFNPFPLPGDDGVPSWNNLLDDLRALLLRAKPQVLILPQPELDPHPDHIAAHVAVLEVLEGLEWQPDVILGYANHLHDNDRWPMGDNHSGVALPPHFDDSTILLPCSVSLGLDAQQDKAMALGMMHDLQPASPFKRRVRRLLQRWLAGRKPSAYGENEYFRKAVRRHELLWRMR